MSAPMSVIVPVLCGTSSTLLVPARAGRRQVTIRNQGSFPVYLSNRSDVTNANGLKLDSGGLIQFSAVDGDQTDVAFYGIGDGGTVACVVIG